jgi:ribonuclease HII
MSPRNPDPSPTGPDMAHERALIRAGAARVAGVDEVGRGPWAGPLVACAARLLRPPPPGLDDSKRLTAARRAALEAPLRAACDWALGVVEAEEIDRLGLGPAWALALARAVRGLAQPPDHLLIDGRHLPPDLPCPATALVGGDARSASIAAASVLAKTWRDRQMVARAARHPGYGWESNKGYGAPAHRAGLAAHGLTPEHRRSFAPVARLLHP